MLFNFRRNDSQVGIVIISGNCCIPGMAVFDEQARRIVEQAVSETGVAAQVKVVPVSKAMFGGLISGEVRNKLMSDYNQSGKIGLPAVLINGKIFSNGVPEIEKLKTELVQIMNSKK
ncbi:MAG: hypothetical protein FIA99_13620 [Ruminiclostridium sp.]|nr:hypothetical protein [Ruminiclostridium sp.]